MGHQVNRVNLPNWGRFQKTSKIDMVGDWVIQCIFEVSSNLTQLSYVFFKHELVYLQLELDVVFDLVLPGWRKDCVGLA